MKQIIAAFVLVLAQFIYHNNQQTTLKNEIIKLRIDNEALLKQAIRAREILKGDSLNTLLYY
jgi:hypothetical protein